MANRDLPVARAALARYGITGRLRCVATGLDTTFRVYAEDGLQYALKVGGVSPARPDQMHVEAAWMEALGRESDVRVPEVVRCDDGLVAVVDGRGAYLVAWLPGRSWRWRLSMAKARDLGNLAARLHVHSRRFRLPPGSAPKLLTPRWMAGQWGEGDPLRDLGVDGMALHDAMKAALGAAEVAIAPKGRGLINADLGPHNVTWLGASVGLFDFNDTGLGWYAYDLARLLRTTRWRDNGESLVDATLGAYRQVTELPEGFIEHGALFEAAANLQLARYMAGSLARRPPDAVDTIRQLVAAVEEALSRS